MKNYSIYLSTENEKNKFTRVTRIYGAEVAAVSGCGNGYYIQINATENQVNKINAYMMGA